MANLFRALLGLSGLALSFQGVASADGVVEINQICAEQTGCFPSDPPGFPVSLNQPGSYRLTSNLDLSTSPSLVSAIHLIGDGISLDLGGFEIVGPVVCTGLGSAINCSPTGTDPGIAAFFSTEGARVMNGRVRGFTNGVSSGARSYVRNVFVESNHNFGIVTGAGSIVIEATAHQNMNDGISVRSGSLIIESISSSNGDEGIDTQLGSVAVGNTSYDNGGDGIEGFTGSLLRENTAYMNEIDGLSGSAGVKASDNVAYQNGRHGMTAGFGTYLQQNTVRSNGDHGLQINPGTTYRENTVNNNALGTIDSGGGLNMGGNSCTGTTSCP